MGREDQSMTLEKDMKSLITRLARLNEVGLPEWDPRDLTKR